MGLKFMEKYLVGIVGSRNTGKTTTTKYLTNTFVDAGHNVAIIKFSSHKFDLDPEHKDSVALRNTKATTIISNTPYETVTFQSTDERRKLPSLLRDLPSEIDVVFCESYPSQFPNIPLIYVCNSIEDYYQTKKRFNERSPLYVTGIIDSKQIYSIEKKKVLSNTDPNHLQIGKRIILENRKNFSKIW